jgi:5-methylthioadenosine/S-adenosylhomocysteine deaminase
MTLLRGVADDMELMPWLETKIWPLEKNLTGERVYVGALLGCLEMIKSGTTCFADQYFFMGDVARAVEEAGIRGALSYGIIELGDPKRRESEIKAGEKLVKTCHGRANGRILTMFGPHAPYTCSTECLLKVKELARKYKVGIHIHLTESDDDIKKTIAFQGERPVKLLDKIGFLGPEVLAAHCVKVTDEEVGMLKKNRVKIAHNPVSNLKLASGIAPVARYLKEGIVVAIGTDGAASNNNLDMFEEMKVCSLVAKIREGNPTVVSAGETLGMATIGGARALRLEKDIGSIEIGKKADIITIDLKRPHLTPVHNVISHLVYAANGSDVDTTIVDGKVLMQGRKVLVLDEDKVLDQAQKASDDLIAKGRPTK